MIKYINVVWTKEHCGYQVTMETATGAVSLGVDLSADEALHTIASALIEPTKKPRYMRTPEELERMDRALAHLRSVGSPCKLELPGGEP